MKQNSTLSGGHTLSTPISDSQTTEKAKRMFPIIGASALGTIIEWYDFFIFGSLASMISKHLFPADSGSSALINTLAIFAAGFIVRPFGSLFFGRLGDIVGRKYTFLLTLIIMGLATFGIGLVPSFDAIGYAAPIIVLTMRLLQGLALGGEFGGATTYVAEYSPNNKRGFYTSFLMNTASIGILLSASVIIATKYVVGEAAFGEWGWRVPFLISILLVIVSIFIRLKMKESPLFSRLKSEGKTAKNPLKESFGNRENLKMVLLALFGAVMAPGIAVYAGQVYAPIFLENICKVDFNQARTTVMIGMALAIPLYTIICSLSDKYGRKRFILAGVVLSIISFPLCFYKMLDITDHSNKKELVAERKVETRQDVDAKTQQPVEVTTTSMLFEGGMQVTSIATQKLQNGVAIGGTSPDVKVTKNLSTTQYWQLAVLAFIISAAGCTAYAPIGAYLVEMFPTRIRYTSMSLPYHVGNGVLGGLIPFLSVLFITMTVSERYPLGNPLAGLYYPIAAMILGLLLGAAFLTDRNHNADIDN